ncbi:MAG: GTPase [Clostridiales bacterium]|nr:GTPase [Clostridiales bacterium]
MEETRVPVYLITGFLESGKTSFLRFTLQQDYFFIDGKTLLILCEEGEEEYDMKALKLSNTDVEIIEKEEDLTPERLMAMDVVHSPERVIVEYNGMWLASRFEEMRKPSGWNIEQRITCVDASTFQTYTANTGLKSIFMDMIREADMVVFNRCNTEDPLPSYRRSIKVVNQKAEVIFEDEEGELGDIFEDEMPFDIDAPVIEILPEDYGIWFVDSMDHPEKYIGKTVRFKGRALKPKGLGSKFFVPGRTAMTCCADDTTFLGYVCKSAYAPRLSSGQWVDVTAKIAFEHRREYQGEGLVLYAEDVTPCEPLAQEMVYFN